MSLNVQLHEGVMPYLVSPYENFFFQIRQTKLTVESGNGYPGQGGCFYGRQGTCYMSQYRLVFVSNAASSNTAYKSFSLPYYAIRDWSFHISLFGSCSWRGHVNRVPGGGLVGIGAFNLDFLSTGFEEFRRHVEPLLENSRAIYSQFLALSAPSVLMVPAKVVDPDAPPQRIAYFAPEDPMTLFLITDTSSDKSHSN